MQQGLFRRRKFRIAVLPGEMPAEGSARGRCNGDVVAQRAQAEQGVEAGRGYGRR